MEIFNIAQISEKTPSIGYDKLYRFFRGEYLCLTMEQITELETAIKDGTKDATKIIKNARKMHKTTNK